ncbi:neuropeptide-like peptide 36 [Ditylenchus destructor]|uniref:Neuropeptide-like peptide 36 n=1 Tax=Ditylenchus destructor TaxID=166010 RepID=A0AAD4NJU7_9BILA|nr:neuropeptide-like peptide 36 [Ditylenchus destructor]
MPKQKLNIIDYFGPVAACIVFFTALFIISVTCLLWCCVTDDDDVTVFAKWGMGPKRRSRYTVHATMSKDRQASDRDTGEEQ